MRFYIGISTFAVALCSAKLVTSSVCPKYNQNAPILSLNEDISNPDVAESYLVLPYRGQELVLHVELLPASQSLEKAVTLSRIRVNGIPLDDGSKASKALLRRTINVPVLKNERDASQSLKSSVSESLQPTNPKGSWVEAEIIGQLGEECPKGKENCIRDLHLMLLATDEVPSPKCGSSSAKKIGVNNASGLVDVKFIDGAQPRLKGIKKVYHAPIIETWMSTYPKIAEEGKFVHKLHKMAFSFNASEYFQNLTSRDGKDRSNWSFLVKVDPVNPYTPMSGYIWSYGYRYTFGDGWTRKKTNFSIIIPSKESGFIIDEPTFHESGHNLPHTQGSYIHHPSAESAEVWFSQKLRKAIFSDFENPPATEDEMIGYMVQEFNITKIVHSDGFVWTAPYERYGWEIMTHKLVEDGQWDDEGGESPFALKIKMYKSTLTSPSPALKYAKLGWRLFTQYVAPLALITVLTAVLWWGVQVGPWAAGWMWRRLQGDSAYEEGQNVPESDDDKDDGYDVGSTEGVMLDYLVAVDDSKPTLKAGNRKAESEGLRDRKKGEK